MVCDWPCIGTSKDYSVYHLCSVCQLRWTTYSLHLSQVSSGYLQWLLQWLSANAFSISSTTWLSDLHLVYLHFPFLVSYFSFLISYFLISCSWFYQYPIPEEVGSGDECTRRHNKYNWVLLWWRWNWQQTACSHLIQPICVQRCMILSCDMSSNECLAMTV